MKPTLQGLVQETRTVSQFIALNILTPICTERGTCEWRARTFHCAQIWRYDRAGMSEASWPCVCRWPPDRRGLWAQLTWCTPAAPCRPSSSATSCSWKAKARWCHVLYILAHNKLFMVPRKFPVCPRKSPNFYATKLVPEPYLGILQIQITCNNSLQSAIELQMVIYYFFFCFIIILF